MAVGQAIGGVLRAALVDAAAEKPGIAAEIFEAVAAESLLVDMIVQGAGRDGLANLSFTVPRDAGAAADGGDV